MQSLPHHILYRVNHTICYTVGTTPYFIQGEPHHILQRVKHTIFYIRWTTVYFIQVHHTVFYTTGWIRQNVIQGEPKSILNRVNHITIYIEWTTLILYRVNQIIMQHYSVLQTNIIFTRLQVIFLIPYFLSGSWSRDTFFLKKEFCNILFELISNLC